MKTTVISTVSLITGACCLFIFQAGMDWINVGTGLHPAIAFPVAILCPAAMMFGAALIDFNEE
jgi:hypothetical protein